MKYLVECDGLNCINEAEIDEPTDENAEDHGWFCDPNEDFHYCSACAPSARAELEAEPYIEM
jgi:hypothetical protein